MKDKKTSLVQIFETYSILQNSYVRKCTNTVRFHVVLTVREDYRRVLIMFSP